MEADCRRCSQSVKLGEWKAEAGLMTDIVHNIDRERAGQASGNGDVVHTDNTPCRNFSSQHLLKRLFGLPFFSHCVQWEFTW
jgi:hypothetical protein